MSFSQIFVSLALSFSLLTSAMPIATAQTRQIPLEDFFKNPKSVSWEISPDGQWLAYMAPYKNRLNVFVRPIDNDDPKRLTSVEERDIGGFFWKGSDRIIFLRDKGGNENFHLYSVERSGGEVKELTPFDEVTVQVIDDLEDHPTDMLIGLNKRVAQVFDVHRINTKTGEMEMVVENPGNYTSYQTDHEGVIRIANATDGVNNTMLYRETDSDDFKEVMTMNFKESVGVQFFDFDNDKVYAMSNRGRDKTALVTMDPETGEESEPLFQHERYDLSGASYSKKREVLTAAFYTGKKQQLHFFDEQSEERYNDLQRQLPGYEVMPTSMNDDETMAVVRTYSDRSRGSYYLYDFDSRELTKLADVSSWIDEDEMAEMQPIEFRARDGLLLEGYLTVPKGVDAKNLPVVVNPHGGPWARDSWGFNPQVQFLANRGYAVLQVNFRGSTGYGRAFWEKSFNQWGLDMQDDITWGVYHLIEEGIADPDRVAIYGASYGGYATLAGVTYTPELYRCGIDYVGVSNLFTFMETIPPYWKPLLDMMYEMVGDPNDPDLKARLRATSPVFQANMIRCPMLVAQGANDPRVNIDESDQIVDALKNNDIPVEYIVKEDEGHGFRNEENRFEFYRAMEAFLEKHME